MTHRTAITRKGLSAPVKVLKARGELLGRVLDFGCGHGQDADILGAEKYDPDGFPDYPKGLFDTILCTYVLNTIEYESEREDVVNRIMNLLADYGCAYYTVRTDKENLNGRTSAGTWQGLIKMPLPTYHKTGWYKTYCDTKYRRMEECLAQQS